MTKKLDKHSSKRGQSFLNSDIVRETILFSPIFTFLFTHEIIYQWIIIRVQLKKSSKRQWLQKIRELLKLTKKKNVARLNLTFERNIKRICETTNLFRTSKSFPMLDIICPHYTKYSNRHPINLYRFDVSRCTVHPSINCYRSYDDTGTVHKYNRRFSDIIRKLRKEFLTSGTLN